MSKDERRVKSVRFNVGSHVDVFYKKVEITYSSSKSALSYNKHMVDQDIRKLFNGHDDCISHPHNDYIIDEESIEYVFEDELAEEKNKEE